MYTFFFGRKFRVDYAGLSANNFYSEDGNVVSYEITDGPGKGAKGESPCEWHQIADGIFAISWQEASGATVVHIDNFPEGHSQTFFTTPDMKFYRLQGQLQR
ncbi:MoaF-related domain-containing protein [Chitinophaga nivalis]|uniref:MoaF-like domain-containing protein n=1 Tax=Chitinophaga nivalis TaxID=2991709 RepID=A0ABT3IHA5_9BACT|nr:hypothetical protein [Chitinophaga nivalis]MCW3466959.1 hypothetical protein [Chitinophaga nivalis]MCW3483350.1 hypothetical protein [Chitinophaga nivalis]